MKFGTIEYTKEIGEILSKAWLRLQVEPKCTIKVEIKE